MYHMVVVEDAYLYLLVDGICLVQLQFIPVSLSLSLSCPTLFLSLPLLLHLAHLLNLDSS